MRSLPAGSMTGSWFIRSGGAWASGVVLVLLGFALDLAPIVVIAAGAAIGVLNIFHAEAGATAHFRQGPGSYPVQAEAE